MKTKIIQDAENEIPTEILAEEIKAISEGIKKLRNSRLNDRALVILIQEAAPKIGGPYNRTKISGSQVKAVLDGMESLEAAYIRKK